MIQSDRPETHRRNATAIRLMVGASALVAGTSILAKALAVEDGAAAGLNPFQISAGRFAFAFLALCLVYTIAPRARPTFAGAHWTWHLLRSLCGWLGITAMFAAVAQMPVAEATAISFLSPLVTLILAALLLGENIGLRKVVATALAIAGAVLILKPGTGAFQAAGLFALASAFFMGLEAIFIKRLSDREPAFRILLINNAIGATVSVAVATQFWVWPSDTQWSLLLILGVVMVSGQSLFIQSMKRGDASHVIPAFYSVLVFAAVYDLALFGVLPDTPGLAGAALIVSGAMLLARSRPADTRTGETD